MQSTLYVVDVSVGRVPRQLRRACRVVGQPDGNIGREHKVREYKAEMDAGCYEFWPAAVETLRRLELKIMKLLRKPHDSADTASKGIVRKTAVMEYTLRCIPVQLQVDKHVLEQAVDGFFAHAAGRCFEMRLAQPRAQE